MGTGRDKALRLRLRCRRLPLGPFGPLGSWTARSFGTGTALTRGTRRTSITTGTRRTSITSRTRAATAFRTPAAVATRATRTTRATGTATGTTAAPITVTTTAALAGVAVAQRATKVARDAFGRWLRSLDLKQALRRRRGALGRQERQDDDAVDLLLHLGPQDVAGLGTSRQQRLGDHAFGFPSAGGTPRPGTIPARARELDFHTA
ncbi:MAG: hypothetical protein QOF21_1799 [Actinomycetota bacterium]